MTAAPFFVCSEELCPDAARLFSMSSVEPRIAVKAL